MAVPNALGIHVGHDRGAALVLGGHLVAQMAQERLDRQKHSNSPELPAAAIDAVLRTAGLQRSMVMSVGVSYTNVRIERILGQLAAEIRDFLGIRHLPVHGVGHHECHAWSTFHTSGFRKSLIIVADGSGDIVGDRLEAESLYFADGARPRLLSRRLQDFGLTRIDRRNAYNLTYMHELDRNKEISVGRKYEQFTYLLGFKHGQAGKTMGLAAYSWPLFVPPRLEFSALDFSLLYEDGLVELDERWKESGMYWHEFIARNSSAIAAAGQALVEAYIIRLLKTLAGYGSTDNLCAAGGLFLNCRLNQQILTQTPFCRLHVIPAAGDDGQCIGAALAAYDAEFSLLHPTSHFTPYLGGSYSEDDIKAHLLHFDLSAEHPSDDALIGRLAEDLAAGKIVGLFRGRSELGPRALATEAS